MKVGMCHVCYAQDVKVTLRTSRARFKIIRTAHKYPFARSVGRELIDERIVLKVLFVRSPGNNR